MEVLADLVGLGAVGLLVAAPLVSLAADLERRLIGSSPTEPATHLEGNPKAQHTKPRRDCCKRQKKQPQKPHTKHCRSPKKWNKSIKHTFTVSEAARSVHVTELQGPHPHWEDRHFVLDHANGAVLAVFDGHGSFGLGHMAAEFCAAEVQHRMLASWAADSDDAAEAPLDLGRIFSDSDAAFIESGSKAAWCAGTTALVVVTREEGIWIANAGDCRAVIARDGVAHRLSTDHKPSHQAERSRISAAGGRLVKPDPRGPVRVCSPDGSTGLAVSRGLGDHAFKHPSVCSGDPLISNVPDVFYLKRTQGDSCIVLGSDGLWDTVGCQEAVDLVRSTPPGESPSDILAAAAVEAGSMDNISVLVVYL